MTIGGGDAGILINEFPPTLYGCNCTNPSACRNDDLYSRIAKKVCYCAYIKFGIELNSSGIKPLQLLFSIFLFKGTITVCYKSKKKNKKGVSAVMLAYEKSLTM